MPTASTSARRGIQSLNLRVLSKEGRILRIPTATPPSFQAAPPWAPALFREVGGLDDPSDRFEVLASGLLDHPVEEIGFGLVALLAEGLSQDVRGMRLLSVLLHEGKPPMQILTSVLELRSLMRAFLKAKREPRGERKEEAWCVPHAQAMTRLASRMGKELPYTLPPPAVRSRVHEMAIRLRKTCRNALEETPGETGNDVENVTAALRAELEALERRADVLADAIDPFAAPRIARALPILTATDEFVQEARGYATMLEEGVEVGERGHSTLGRLFERVDPVELDLWLQAGDDGMRLLHRLIQARLSRVLSAAHLSAYAGLISHLMALATENRPGTAEPTAIECTYLALSLASEEGIPISRKTWSPKLIEKHFGPTTEIVEDHGAADLEGGTHWVRLNRYGLEAFVQDDGTPLLARQEKRERPQSARALVASVLNKENVLLQLLRNPKVTATPGVVPLVANRCRSSKVLAVVANTPNLHSGPINRDVPRLLLSSPMHLPLSLIRKFIHVRYVSKADLRLLAKRGSDVRQEIKKEIQAYLRTL